MVFASLVPSLHSTPGTQLGWLHLSAYLFVCPYLSRVLNYSIRLQQEILEAMPKPKNWVGSRPPSLGSLGKFEISGTLRCVLRSFKASYAYSANDLACYMELIFDA